MFSLVHFPCACAPENGFVVRRCSRLPYQPVTRFTLSLCQVKPLYQLAIDAEMKGEARNSSKELITLLILG